MWSEKGKHKWENLLDARAAAAPFNGYADRNWFIKCSATDKNVNGVESRHKNGEIFKLNLKFNFFAPFPTISLHYMKYIKVGTGVWFLAYVHSLLNPISILLYKEKRASRKKWDWSKFFAYFLFIFIWMPRRFEAL